MGLPRLRSLAIGRLALIFTIGLTIAGVVLPCRIDRLLMETVATPDFDSRATPARIYRAELFIRHYHLRLIGYLLSSVPSAPCSPIPC
jgi:hypothetical protein